MIQRGWCEACAPSRGAPWGRGPAGTHGEGQPAGNVKGATSHDREGRCFENNETAMLSAECAQPVAAGKSVCGVGQADVLRAGRWETLRGFV